MVRRRSRRGTVSVPALGVGVLLVLLVVVLQELAAHPAVLVAVLVLAVGGAAGAGALAWQRRTRQRVEAQRQWQLAFMRSQEIARYHLLGPKEFEHALAFLCARDGCTEVRVVGGAGDLGADVLALAPDGRRIVLQAKRYGPTSKVVGPDLQKFGGTCFTVHRAHVAAVVTTSSFTKQARDYAAHMGIRLYDHHGLAAWATRTGPAPWT